jgi:hypothetical protein
MEMLLMETHIPTPQSASSIVHENDFNLNFYQWTCSSRNYMMEIMGVNFWTLCIRKMA